MSINKGIVVFSGGSAANSLVDVFDSVRRSQGCRLSYIIPISDNGGSSSELIRVFGGPGIGDVRSRLVRLIPSHRPISTERAAIADLFNHRLSSTSSQQASHDWQSLVDGTSLLWSRIPSAKKQLIRSFFNLLNLEILKRSRPPTSTFDFTSASVGNLFLTGARLFSGSFESAIYLLGSICGVSDDVVRVIPAINSNFTHHIAAGLADGSVIVGQNSISHPLEVTALESPVASPRGHRSAVSHLSLGDPEAVLTDDHQSDCHHNDREGHRRHSQARLPYRSEEQAGIEAEEDANLPCSLPTLRTSAIKFSKEQSSSSGSASLRSRIERIWYINPYGQEISPPPNPRVCEAIRSAQAIIYSIGSLYTSIVPSILLRGVGEAIRHNITNSTTTAEGTPRTETRKIFILNGTLDREVGPTQHPFTALDFVDAIVRAGEESRGLTWTGKPSSSSPSKPRNQQHETNPDNDPTVHSKYITHLLHLTGPGTPHVDPASLRALGIQPVPVPGQRVESQHTEVVPVGGDEEKDEKGEKEQGHVKVQMRYDPASLVQALEHIICHA